MFMRPLAFFCFTLLAGLALASCGDDVELTDSPTKAEITSCTRFCEVELGCFSADHCVLPDPAAGAAACVERCAETRVELRADVYVSLTTAEWAALDDCLSCDECDRQVACAPACDGAGQGLAQFHQALSWIARDAAALVCTNGRQALFDASRTDCDIVSMGSECTAKCCQYCCGDEATPCATPGVSATCTEAGGEQACVCTAGKNVGKEFVQSVCSYDDLWNQCNL